MIQDNYKIYYGDRFGQGTAINHLVENMMIISMDRKNTTGLSWYYHGGDVKIDSVIYTVADGFITLTDNDVNYIYVNNSGVVSKSLVGYEGGIPIAQITTASGAITEYLDKRTWLGQHDLTGYLKLDQTTPQTVINGVPIFDLGIKSNNLTAGQICFPDTDKKIIGDSNLFWDDTNNRFGIGTNAPTAKITIVGETESHIHLTRYSNASTSNEVIGFKARGTISSPVVINASDTLLNLAGRGYDGANFSGTVARIQLLASQAFTASNQGTYIAFATTTNNTTTIVNSMYLTNKGELKVGQGVGASSPGYTFYVAPNANATAGQTAFIQDATATTGSTKIVIKSGAGQSTGNLQEWQNISAAVMGSISETELITPATLKIKNSAKINSFTNSGSQADGTLAYTLPSAYPAVTGYVLSSTDAGVMSWIAAGGGGSPAGSDREIQWNNAGAFGASSKFVFSASDELRVGTLSAGVFTGSEMLTTSSFRVSADNGYGAQISTTISIGAQPVGNHVIALPIPSTAPSTGDVLKLSAVYDDGYGNYNLQTEWGAGGSTSPIIEDATPSFALHRLNETLTGNTRGYYAIDLQYEKANAAQVASAVHSLILGGKNNQNDNLRGIIVGGNGNYISNAIIFGGADEVYSGNSAIVGGALNFIGNNNRTCFIGGGAANKIENVTDTVYGMGSHVITGGLLNEIKATGSPYYQFVHTIGGGQQNKITATQHSTIAGGILNEIKDSFSAIAGGYSNEVFSAKSFVGGGYLNTISNGGDGNNVICGGYDNFLQDGWDVICGGYQNYVRGNYGFIGGGKTNKIDQSTEYNAIVGGLSNLIDGGADYSFIGGGASNGIKNNYSAIPGGYLNTCYSSYSFACGSNAHADSNYCFVFADGNSTTSSRTNQALFGVQGGLYIAYNNSNWVDFYDDSMGNQITTSSGATLTTGGVWTDASSRELKIKIADVDNAEILQKVMNVPVQKYQYKKETDGTKHIGLYSEDFYQAFKVGNDKGLGATDLCGVLWSAVQELKKELDILKDYIKLQ